MVVAVMMSRDMCTMALEVAAVIAATRITRNSIHVQQFPRKPERATLNTKLVIAFGHHPGRPRQRPATGRPLHPVACSLLLFCTRVLTLLGVGLYFKTWFICI